MRKRSVRQTPFSTRSRKGLTSSHAERGGLGLAGQHPDAVVLFAEVELPHRADHPVRGLPADLAEYLDRVSGISQLPVCAGFGIRAAGDVASVGQHAAGAIVGSALVEVLERGEDPQRFLASLLTG